MRLTILIRFFITGLVLAASILAAVMLWRHYMYSPWTRDGRVRADVITIAPDVAGLVESVPVKDNQFVKKGDLLLRIDPERYRLALAQARAQVEASKAESERLHAEAQRRAKVSTDVVSREGHEQAFAAATTAETRVREAEARLDLAALNLERTEIRSPVDGYVTNLAVFPGDYASVGTPRMAIIDANSFWIAGYFEETKLSSIAEGDTARIELLDGSPAFTGVVEGIARGIGERDNPTGSQLLLNVNPTYNWVRLAQRIPVRIKIVGSAPIGLSMGMSCTITIQKAK